MHFIIFFCGGKNLINGNNGVEKLFGLHDFLHMKSYLSIWKQLDLGIIFFDSFEYMDY